MFESELRATYFGSLRAKLILAPLGISKWVKSQWTNIEGSCSKLHTTSKHALKTYWNMEGVVCKTTNSQWKVSLIERITLIRMSFPSPSHNFGPHQVLVKLAQEVGRQGIKPGTRKINGRYIHSHLASRLEGEKLYSHPWSFIILELDLSSLGELLNHFTHSSQNVSCHLLFLQILWVLLLR